MILVEFQPQVVINDARGEISGRHGELHFVSARFQQRGVERLAVFMPNALVGVVADGVGGDWPDGADVLAVDRHRQTAKAIRAGQRHA